MNDVYWLARWWCCTVTGTGSKYLEYNPGSELNIFPVNNEQRKLNRTKITERNNEQKSNKDR